MSQENIKEKKTFLKKGSRQFLSNAQVRSQSSKPKIVDFGADDEQAIKQFPIKIKSQNAFSYGDEEQIKIKAKPATTKSIPAPKKDISAKKVDRNKFQPPVDHSPYKPKREVSIGKKKQMCLSDYLDNESGLQEQTQKKPRLKQQGINNNYRKEQTKKLSVPKSKVHQNTKAANLVQQNDEQQQKINWMENDSFMPIQNPIKNKQTNATKKNKYQITQQKQKEKEHSEDQQMNNQVNFISDQQENSQKNYRNQRVYNEERKQNIIQNKFPVSKVKMNYFNKQGGKQKNNNQVDQLKQKNIKKQLTIHDVPKQLKELIIKEAIAAKQQQMLQTLLKIKQKQESLKKQKQKLQDENKNFIKMKQQFEKEMQLKNQQFQEKLKNQNSKLARQKKYMKDAQMSGKGDWKAKVQLQQAKKAAQQIREQKKKNQSKYKAQIENLRKKLQEETNKNKLLTEQVKLLEYGQLMHKQRMKEIVKDQKRNSQQSKATMWADVPQNSYLNRVIEADFSLIQMDSSDYHYQLNQYYQYYLKIKDQVSPLESQAADIDRAKRVYKNGKIEHQYFQKFLKQIFPFNYTIVQLWNGDVKQILPQGIQVYYSKNSGVTQITIKQKDYAKQICYFPNNETVQMTVVYENQPNKNVTQVYCNGHLKKMLSDGTVVLEKKDNKGNIVKINGY